MFTKTDRKLPRGFTCAPKGPGKRPQASTIGQIHQWGTLPPDYIENTAPEEPGPRQRPFDKNVNIRLVFRFRILIGLNSVDITFLQFKNSNSLKFDQLAVDP